MSKCKPGDPPLALHKNFGSDAVGSMSFHTLAMYLIVVLVLVDGELWTDESVLWQNKLKDRGRYEVVYRTLPPPLSHGTEIV